MRHMNHISQDAFTASCDMWRGIHIWRVVMCDSDIQSCKTYPWDMWCVRMSRGARIHEWVTCGVALNESRMSHDEWVRMSHEWVTMNEYKWVTNKLRTGYKWVAMNELRHTLHVTIVPQWYEGLSSWNEDRRHVACDEWVMSHVTHSYIYLMAMKEVWMR